MSPHVILIEGFIIFLLSAHVAPMKPASHAQYVAPDESVHTPWELHSVTEGALQVTEIVA